MNIGIVGLSNSGKTTVFNALTGADASTAAYAGSGQEQNVATVKVPDEKLDYLFDMYTPQKKVQVELKFVDFAGVQKGQGGGFSDRFIGDLRTCDALLLVVRAFNDEAVPHPDDRVDPAGDLETLLFELCMADLQVMERRLEKIQTGIERLSKEDKERLRKEEPIVLKIKEALENEQLAADVELSPEEEKTMRSYEMLSRKPMMVVVNVGEDQLGKGLEAPVQEVLHEKFLLMEMAGQLEMEISQLEGEEQVEFLADAGIESPARARVIRHAYQLLGVVNFYTAGGKKDVTAWQVHRGDNALAAAGKIHSDIARGFIRAEVVNFDDLKEHGTEAAVKEAGKYRLEGKEYIVKDGDILNFRFNV